MKKNIAAIDLGTNTIRLLIAEPKGDKDFHIIHSEQEIVRTGKGLSENGCIREESMRRTINALLGFKKRIEDFDVKKTLAVATSALREAKNSDALLLEIKKRLDLDVDIVSGEEEGRLTLLGVFKGVGKAHEKSLIVDIGGGSTEFIRVEGGRSEKLLSVDLGVVKLRERYLLSDPACEKEISDMEREITDKVRGAGEELNIKGETSLIGTAGTFTTLAAMDLAMEIYEPKRVNGYVMKRGRIEDIFEMLVSKTLKERKEIPGLERGREDVIVPGTATVIKIMEYFDCKETIISDYGLREGVLVDYLEGGI